jgi:hypothetical protein
MVTFFCFKKVQIFYRAPTVSCSLGIGGPSPEIKMEGVKMTTCFFLIPELIMCVSVPSLFRTLSCCLHAKLYLFMCIKTSVFQAENSFAINFCLSRTYPNVLQVCHMFQRLGLSSGAGCSPHCYEERIALLHIPPSCL